MPIFRTLLLTIPIFLLLGCGGSRQFEVKPPPVPELPDFNRAVETSSLIDSSAAGMVVSAHATATAVGKYVLQNGGNAVDATLATLAALNIVEPQATTIGGGGYALYYDAALDSFFTLDFRERAPAVIDYPTYFQPEDSDRVAQRWGATSVLIPGCAAGWHEFYDRFGNKSLVDIFAPAVKLARGGFPLSDYQHHSIEDKVPYLKNNPAIAEIFLEEGHAIPAGTIVRQPALANLYRHLSLYGLNAFYTDSIATDIITALQTDGSTISLEDFASYEVKYREPLRTEYHGYEIVSLGPPSGGGIGIFEGLELLKGYDLGSMEHLGLESTHLIASAVRIARENYRYWIADPDYYDIPVDSLLSPYRISQVRTESIFPDSLDRGLDRMSNSYAGNNTTHLVVADSSGNLMCLTQSINYYFGACWMDPDWGVIMNNLMADFDHDTTGLNAMKPLHRPASTMAATMILKDGKPLYVLGTPGGTRIASTMTQVIVGLIDYGLTLEQALAAPRFYTAGRRLAIENRFSQEVFDGLASYGWNVDPKEAYDAYFGGVNAIYLDDSRGYIGASDPRRDGSASGL